MIEGNNIRIPIPELSQERRIEIVKVASKYSEEAKITIRNIRREANEELKKKLKSDLSFSGRPRILAKSW